MQNEQLILFHRHLCICTSIIVCKFNFIDIWRKELKDSSHLSPF